jgi:hypothetical protein
MIKTIDSEAKWAEADTDGDGVITEEEIALYERKVRFENEDKKEDAQRNMAWFALFGMLLYPFAVLLSNLLGLSTAANVLGDMAPTYFVSVAAIVAAFYGKEAYTKKRDSKDEQRSETGKSGS